MSLQGKGGALTVLERNYPTWLHTSVICHPNPTQSYTSNTHFLNSLCNPSDVMYGWVRNTWLWITCESLRWLIFPRLYYWVRQSVLAWLNRTVLTGDPVDFWAILLRYHIWTYILYWICWKWTFYQFHPCLPQYHTKHVVVDIGHQSSDYSTKFLQYRPRKGFTVGESQMTNVTFSFCITNL